MEQTGSVKRPRFPFLVYPARWGHIREGLSRLGLGFESYYVYCPPKPSNYIQLPCSLGWKGLELIKVFKQWQQVSWHRVTSLFNQPA